MESEKRRQILVVDDDPAVRQALCDALEDEGYVPLPFATPGEALAGEAARRAAFAFLDVNLPEMSGLLLAEKLAAINPDLMTVFITGYHSLEDAVRAIRLGAFDYLKKPFTGPELSLTLTRLEERRRLKEQVRQAEERHATLVANVPVLIFTLNADMDIDFMNQACRSMLGYAPEETRSAHDWLLSSIHPEDRDQMRKTFLAALESGDAFTAEFRMVHREGHVLDVMGQSLGNLPGENVGLCLECVITDITDRVLLEKRLLLDEKLRTLGAITAEVAHEIRNPLVSIGGFARRLQKKFPTMDEADIILREAERLERLLSRINNYLSPVMLKRSRCQAGRILSECLDLLSPEVDERGVWPALHLAENLPPVLADPDVLRQVFINLILGALKNMEAGAELNISAHPRGGSVFIIFKARYQEGRTVNPEDMFRPFEDGGPSIGMPLTYRLIKHMDGVLSFDSEDHTAVFTMTLPVFAEPAAGTESRSEPACLSAQTAASFDSLFQREWLRAAREVQPLGLVTVRVERFEEYERVNGRDTANRCLERVGAALSQTLKRPADLLSHCGGNAFAAVLPGTPKDGAESVALAMRRAVEELSLPFAKGSDELVRVLTGVASRVPTPASLPDDLLAEANAGMA